MLETEFVFCPLFSSIYSYPPVFDPVELESGVRLRKKYFPDEIFIKLAIKPSKAVSEWGAINKVFYENYSTKASSNITPIVLDATKLNNNF